MLSRRGFVACLLGTAVSAKLPLYAAGAGRPRYQFGPFILSSDDPMIVTWSESTDFTNWRPA